MIAGITSKQQKVLKQTIQIQKQLEKELDFTLSCLDINYKKENSFNCLLQKKASFSSFKSEQPEDKYGIRKLKTMDSIKEIKKDKKKCKKENHSKSKLFQILENLFNC